MNLVIKDAYFPVRQNWIEISLILCNPGKAVYIKLLTQLPDAENEKIKSI